MKIPSALALPVAAALFEKLSGFRGFPKPGIGKVRFVQVFQQSVISVDHARAVIATFDDQMPTLREIRDTAYTLRSKFEPPVDQRQQWEKEYGPPDLEWSQRFAEGATATALTVDPAARKRQHQEERRAMLWQAIRDSLYYTEGPGSGRPSDFWQTAMEKHKRNHPDEVAAFRLELQQSGWDNLMAYDWAKGSFPPAARRQGASGAVVVLEDPITAEDVQRELRAQGREPGDE
jgi:hypothetical protein